MKDLRGNERQSAGKDQFPRKRKLAREIDPQENGQNGHAQKADDISSSKHSSPYCSGMERRRRARSVRGRFATIVILPLPSGVKTLIASQPSEPHSLSVAWMCSSLVPKSPPIV